MSQDVIHFDIASVNNIQVGICTHSLEWYSYINQPGDNIQVGLFKCIQNEGKSYWDDNIRFTAMTTIAFPNKYDIPLLNARGRIRLLT